MQELRAKIMYDRNGAEALAECLAGVVRLLDLAPSQNSFSSASAVRAPLQRPSGVERAVRDASPSRVASKAPLGGSSDLILELSLLVVRCRIMPNRDQIAARLQKVSNALRLPASEDPSCCIFRLSSSPSRKVPGGVREPGRGYSKPFPGCALVRLGCECLVVVGPDIARFHRRANSRSAAPLHSS